MLTSTPACLAAASGRPGPYAISTTYNRRHRTATWSTSTLLVVTAAAKQVGRRHGDSILHLRSTIGGTPPYASMRPATASAPGRPCPVSPSSRRRPDGTDRALTGSDLDRPHQRNRRRDRRRARGLVATAALRPVRRSDHSGGDVAATGDLTERVRSRRPTSSAGSRRASTRCSRRSRSRSGAAAARRRRVARASGRPLRRRPARTSTSCARGGCRPEEAKHALDEAAIEELAALTRSSPTSSSSRAARSESCGSKTCSSTIWSPGGGARAVTGARGDIRDVAVADAVGPIPVLLERAVLEPARQRRQVQPGGARSR